MREEGRPLRQYRLFLYHNTAGGARVRMEPEAMLITGCETITKLGRSAETEKVTSAERGSSPGKVRNWQSTQS